MVRAGPSLVCRTREVPSLQIADAPVKSASAAGGATWTGRGVAVARDRDGVAVVIDDDLIMI